jgi:hypothetical protein
MVGLVLAFGLLMTLRKDLYVLIAFHFLVNTWMAYRPGEGECSLNVKVLPR